MWRINCSSGIIFLLYVPMMWIPSGACLSQFVLQSYNWRCCQPLFMFILDDWNSPQWTAAVSHTKTIFQVSATELLRSLNKLSHILSETITELTANMKSDRCSTCCFIFLCFYFQFPEALRWFFSSPPIRSLPSDLGQVILSFCFNLFGAPAGWRLLCQDVCCAIWSKHLAQNASWIKYK